MEDFLEGQILLFDKPLKWTSFDLVKKVRNAIRIRKVGHAGTLDPLATGLLIICTGKKTKSIPEIQDLEKEYEVVFKLGATTASYDAEQPEENIQPADHITVDQLKTAMKAFQGQLSQIPPAFSAVKVNGKRAYEEARKGKKLVLKPRTVNINEFSIISWESPYQINARVRCSKGTYIRSLIHDLGQKLEVGGYITQLKRSRIGNYKLEDAWQISDFVDHIRKDINKRK